MAHKYFTFTAEGNRKVKIEPHISRELQLKSYCCLVSEHTKDGISNLRIRVCNKNINSVVILVSVGSC